LRQLDDIIRRAYAMALAERGGVGRDLVLERRHADRALAHEAPSESGKLLPLLWRAANAFVLESERRGRGGAPLSLDLTEAFRGLVLGAAMRRAGTLEEAFALLGQEQLLKNRNHARTARRALAHVRSLVELLGDPLDPELDALLKETDDSA
jgi:hypothetical protein